MTTHDTTASDLIHPSVALLDAGVVYYDDATREHYLASYEDWARLFFVGDYSLWCADTSHPQVFDDQSILAIAEDHYEAVEREFGFDAAQTCNADDFEDGPLRQALIERRDPTDAYIADQTWTDGDWRDYVGFEVRRLLSEALAGLAQADSERRAEDAEALEDALYAEGDE